MDWCELLQPAQTIKIRAGALSKQLEEKIKQSVDLINQRIEDGSITYHQGIEMLQLIINKNGPT
jgi:hypothetical protein